MLNGGEMGRKIMENPRNSTTLNGGQVCRKTRVSVGTKHFGPRTRADITTRSVRTQDKGKHRYKIRALNGGLACRKTKVFVGNSTLFGAGRIPQVLSHPFGGGITI